MNIWPYLIALLLIYLYKKRSALFVIFKHQKMKKNLGKLKDEFISVRTQELVLRMDETINTIKDIIDDLTACKPMLNDYKLRSAEELIDKAIELKEEYKEIRNELGQDNHSQESLDSIDHKLENFKIKLNNKLAVGVRQLLSKVKNNEIKQNL